MIIELSCKCKKERKEVPKDTWLELPTIFCTKCMENVITNMFVEEEDDN